MNNLNLLNSIVGFETAYHTINNYLMEEIACNSSKIEMNNVYLDHIINLQSIGNFSKIQYLEANKPKKTTGNDPIGEKILHSKKHLEILKAIPHSLIDDIEKSRISLFLAWNKGIDKKTFCHAELNNYINHYKNYCEIAKNVFEKNTNYDGLLASLHPQFSSQSIEEIFKKVSPKLKDQAKKIKDFSKNIKVTKLDDFLIKDEQYKEIIKQIKNNFDIHDTIQNFGQMKISDNKQLIMNAKLHHDFQDKLTNVVTSEIEDYIYSKFFDKTELFKNPNLKLFSKTISYFFGFYLLKSQQYIDVLSDNIKRIVKCKSKISDNQNLYWLFNKYPEEPNPSNCSEIQEFFFQMLTYVIERDLINGNLDAKDLPDVWIKGIKHYFDIDAKPENVLQNVSIGLGQFGNCAFKTHAIINSAMIFSQYESKVVGKDFDATIIKKFVQNFSSNDIDYQTYAMLDKTQNNIEVLMKVLENRLL